jgi:hypothetical protein
VNSAPIASAWRAMRLRHLCWRRAS